MNKVYIETFEDLNNLRNLNEGEYIVILCNDLNLEGKYITPINFKDTNVIFDGNFHSITNLNMDFPYEDNIGLFNTIGDSVIVVKDLELSGSIEGRDNVGLLGGTFNGVINNSHFTGSVYGFDNLGGLVGKSTNKLILNGCTLEMDYPYSTINYPCKEYYKPKKIGYIVAIANKLLVSNCTYNVACDKLSSDYSEVLIKPKKVLKRKKD